MKKLLIILLVLLGLQIQAQVNSCDSITYWTDQGQGLFVGLDTTSLTQTDSIEVIWQVCNSNTCYSGFGVDAFFGQIIILDTIKVCYDIYLYTTNMVEVCMYCDSLVFDQSIYSWVLFNMGNTTFVNDLTTSKTNNSKIYDLLGRELKHIPTGSIYIKNGRLYK
jgi:hypothetical protein